MNKFFQGVLRFLPHLNIALAVNLFTFFVIDRLNRAMAFIDNDLTKWMLAVFCLLVVVESVVYIAVDRGLRKERAKKKKKPRPEKRDGE